MKLKPLVWADVKDASIARLPFGLSVMSGKTRSTEVEFFWTDSQATGWSKYQCSSIEDGKRQAEAWYRKTIMSAFEEDT